MVPVAIKLETEELPLRPAPIAKHLSRKRIRNHVALEYGHVAIKSVLGFKNLVGYSWELRLEIIMYPMNEQRNVLYKQLWFGRFEKNRGSQEIPILAPK